MTITEWCQHIAASLSHAEFENSSQEAKWLIASALGHETSFLFLNPAYHPSLKEEKIIQDWTARRLQGEPLSRLKGMREFWSLSFHLNEHTLDPRPDTETLIEGILHWLGNRKDEPSRILDLGTGSGCLLITLLHECPKAKGIGIDLKEEALEMARLNAALNQVDSRALFQQGDWGKDLQGSFEIIVSNPPYIPLKDKANLPKNVLHFDPPLALFGGTNGLEAYRLLRDDIKRLLSPTGIAVLEFGDGQRKDVEFLFHEIGFETAFVLQDLSHRERGIGFRIL